MDVDAARRHQTEKLAALGELCTYVAHEINNPIGYISSNVSTLGKYLEKIESMQDACERPVCQQNDRLLCGPKAFREDLRDLLAETGEGLTRVLEIVKTLKEFAGPDDVKRWARMDIRECIEASLKIAGFALGKRVCVVRQFADIPAIDCLPGRLKQLFLNLPINAAHAIPADTTGTITIRTRAEDDSIRIEFEDTGCGISADDVERIFEPFFTTKPVGIGTGLGLSVSREIAHEHGAEISVRSTPGAGSCFALLLPLPPASADERDAT